MTSFEIPRNTREYYLNELITLNMNAKMDSGSLSYEIRTCFITKTSLILHSRDCSHYSELSVTQVFKNYFHWKLLSHYHIKTSQLICIVNQLAGFFMVQVFTEECFGKDPVGTWYFGDIGFLLGFYRDVDRLRIDIEVT